MDNQELEFIQNQIGYTFRNVDLLQQAFVRRSYAKENGGEDNEVLEFIGDKALDFSVVRVLMEKYGYLISECEDYNPNEDFNEFACEYDEGKLTEIKKCLVEKKMLAHRIDELGLSDYLIM
ncbi:MAG: ribonuclease III family protein, partial [Lachnospiraceae bacterium]|nr:ribonuclease III family protein [Lachnospiraceae bacterium]